MGMGAMVMNVVAVLTGRGALTTSLRNPVR